MKCTSVEFVVSARSTADYPKERRPEIAVAGRSNVGKSSLINALLKRRQVARVSATPGKTRGINYFLVNGSFFLVDLPGYGYARISRSEQQQWERMVRDYLHAADRPKLVLALVDSRHPPSPLDLALRDWLAGEGLEYVVVATKADKLSGNERTRNLAVLRKAYPGAELMPFSSTTELGRLQLLGRLQQYLDTNEKNAKGGTHD